MAFDSLIFEGTFKADEELIEEFLKKSKR